MNYVGNENWVELQEAFTALGDEGWELVTYMDDLHYLESAKEKGKEPVLTVRLFVFKRSV